MAKRAQRMDATKPDAYPSRPPCAGPKATLRIQARQATLTSGTPCNSNALSQETDAESAQPSPSL